MKAIKWNCYGPPDCLSLVDLPTPVPGPKQILLKIHAVTVFAGDCELRRFDMLPLFWLPLRLYIGVRRPKRLQVLGQEVSEVVVETGSEVTDYSPGDEVFAPLTAFGGYAEYVKLRADQALARKPADLDHGEAAALCVGGVNALYFLRRAGLQPDERVLLVGAGGSIGTLMIQLAKRAGAIVTAVDSADKLEALRDLGADQLIDYRSGDLASLTERFDVVVNIVNKSSFGDAVRLLKDDGRLILINTIFSQMLRGWWLSKITRKTVIGGIAGYKSEHLNELAAMVAGGELRVVIDRRCSLAEVPEAHRYVDSGAKLGNLVVDVEAPREASPSRPPPSRP